MIISAIDAITAASTGPNRTAVNAIGAKANPIFVSAKYCYAIHELRLHQNDRCKRFTLV